jgi:type II secretion system protein H
MPRQRHNFGFTLVELVLVMAIIAIVCMIAAPSLGGFARGRTLPNTASQLAATARWCRVQAINDSVRYRLNLNPTAGKWWVTKDDGTDGLTFVEIKHEEMAKEFTVPEGVKFETSLPSTEEGTYITFDPAGRTDVAEIHLTYETNAAVVKCDRSLGSFYVVDPRTQRADPR